MPALRKYDQETRDRAVRLYRERRRDNPQESGLEARKRVGELPCGPSRGSSTPASSATCARDGSWAGGVVLKGDAVGHVGLEQALFTRRRADARFTARGIVFHSDAGSLIEHDRRRSWTGRAEVEQETASWVHWFNNTRIHHAIGKRSPIEFEEHYLQTANPPIGEVA